MKLSYQSSSVPVEYEDALSAMEQLVAAVAAGQATGMLWLLEHPPLYTAGTSAKQADLLVADRFPVFQTGRGGEYTYHGPGQRVGYVMMHLGQRGGCKGKDVRCFVRDLEQWLINSLQHFGLKGETREGRVGVWVNTPRGEAKIAALGVRVRHWVSFHGVALNVAPDLSHFQGIVPCGLRDYGVTSLAELGIHPSMDEVDRILKHHFADIFDAEWVEEALQS